MCMLTQPGLSHPFLRQGPVQGCDVLGNILNVLELSIFWLNWRKIAHLLKEE